MAHCESCKPFGTTPCGCKCVACLDASAGDFEGFTKEAIRATHRRLEKELREFAEREGFTKDIADTFSKDTRQNPGANPDVAQLSEDGEALFVGDAKDPEIQTAKDADPDQFERYFDGSNILMLGKKKQNSSFAVATGTEEEAKAWCAKLQRIADQKNRGSYSFSVQQLGEQTWLAISRPR